MKNKLTIKKVNEAIKETGYELVKGNGYFYFWPLAERTDLANDLESVAVCHLNAFTLERWIEELNDRIKNSLSNSYTMCQGE